MRTVLMRTELTHGIKSTITLATYMGGGSVIGFPGSCASRRGRQVKGMTRLLCFVDEPAVELAASSGSTNEAIPRPRAGSNETS